jgi:hypothetical protein
MGTLPLEFVEAFLFTVFVSVVWGLLFRRSSQSWLLSPPGLVIVFLLTYVLLRVLQPESLATLQRFFESGWFAKPANATAVQALAAVAQVILAVVLIVLTVRTVRANAKIAAETADMARSTEHMATAALEQQRAATRPVLAFRIHPPDGHKTPDARELVIEALNVGAGPALDTRVVYSGPFNYAEPTDYVQPLAIAASEAPMFTFKLDHDSPMLDKLDLLKWPRTAEIVALQEEGAKLEGARVWKDWKDKNSPDAQRLRDIRQDLKIKSNDYDTDLIARVVEQHVIGQVRAEYLDLSGTAHVSSADLLATKPEVSHHIAESHMPDPEIWGFRPHWPEIKLGSLSVRPVPLQPRSSEGATEAAPSEPS